jgi:hypothetical protein
VLFALGIGAGTPDGGGIGGIGVGGAVPAWANAAIVDVSVKSEDLTKHPNILILPS